MNFFFIYSDFEVRRDVRKEEVNLTGCLYF